MPALLISLDMHRVPIIRRVFLREGCSLRSVRALKRRLRLWMVAVLRVPRLVGVMAQLAKHASLRQHLEASFSRAIERMPEHEGGLIRRYWFLIFEALVWNTLFRNQSLTRLLVSLEEIGLQQGNIAARSSEPISRTAGDKLHILFVTAVFPSVEHGGGLRVFDLITELDLRGHRVSLFSTDVHATPYSLKTLSKCLEHVEVVKHWQFNQDTYRDWLVREAPRFDAIHYVWPESAALMPVAKFWVEKTVFEFIECCSRRCVMDIERQLSTKNFEALESAAHDLLENWRMESMAVGHADELIALTDDDAKFIRHLFGTDRVTLVPTSLSRTLVDNAEIDAASITHHFGRESALFVGNFNHYPNKDAVCWFLDNIHDRVLAMIPGFRMVIAGAGNVSDLRRRYAGKQGVSFIGEVSDLMATFKGARICVAPLISGAGIRGKIQQYSFAGRPSVSTTIGISGTPFCHEQSILVADQPNAFANCVVRLIQDDELYESIRAEARKVVLENFLWSPHVDRLEQVYRR